MIRKIDEEVERMRKGLIWIVGKGLGLMAKEEEVNVARRKNEEVEKMRKGLSVIVGIAVLLFAYSAGAGVVTNNLVSWWTFDNATNGIAYDTAPAGNNNTGTITGATWTNVTAGSASSGALYFNGSSDYVDCTTNSSLRPTNAITIEVWAKPNVVGDTAQQLCDNGNNAVNDWGASLDLRDTGKYRAILGNGSYRRLVSSATSYTTNEWQHFVVTWDGDGDTTIRLYRNATLDTTTDTAWLAKPLTYSLGEMTIGAAQWGGYYFNGIIDEVRIYDKALNQSEIQQNYDAIPEPSTLLLLGGGLFSLLAFRRRGRR